MKDAGEEKNFALEDLIKRPYWHGMNYALPFIVARHFENMVEDNGKYKCGPNFTTDKFDRQLALLIVNSYFYVHNANLRARRNMGEMTIIKRISSVAQRALNKGEMTLEPNREELNADAEHGEELDPMFVQGMERIMPFVNDYNKNTGKKKRLTIRDLSSQAGIDVKNFYRLISDNIYKNPRPLFIKLKLDHAEKLLRNKALPLDYISEECGFVSTNFLIAAFFRSYRMTPAQFRETL
jgi:AraC-like DNA-binding protein